MALREQTLAYVGELIVVEPEKKEVMLNYAKLKGQWLLLEKRSLEDLDQEVSTLKEMVFKLKGILEDQGEGDEKRPQPLFDAVWDSIIQNFEKLI